MKEGKFTMDFFSDNIIGEYVEWKKANENKFSWWNYVNLKADLKTALAFAKFFSPELIQYKGCIILKDKFNKENFDLWQAECNFQKTDIEKIVNLYEVADFFHINTGADDNYNEQLYALGQVLKYYWSISFKEQFPNNNIVVEVFTEFDDIFITVYEN